MKPFFKISFIFIFIFSYSIVIGSKASNNLLENVFDINLEKEIKKGNFLIGLRQYLGKNHKKEEVLIFKTEDNFLRLKSSNGLNHQSKEIKIVLKSIPLKNPIIIERLVSRPFASYESAKKESLSLEERGLKPIITMPRSWEIWLPVKKVDQVNSNYTIKQQIVKNKIVPYLTNEYIYKKLDGPISIISKEEIKIDNINYGKNFLLVKDSYGTWTLVQKISFEEYLNGVLPHEIGASSPIESLKAQAVIARTWAIYNSNRFKEDKFHLCVTTQCQVYKPSISNEKIKKAISETKYEILTYKDKPINSFYHASNGGISATSNESWKMKDYPYLISKLDIIDFHKKDKDFNMRTKKNLLFFLQENENKFFGKDHYLFRWKKKVSSKAINNLLIKNNLSKQNSKILNLKVIERGVSGRVTKLEINHSISNNPIILVKDDIRKYLNFLPSNLFIIDKLNDNLWVFNGGGFGHGVGLSQSGAIEMAKNGLPYQKILKHYYKGTKIQKYLNLTN